MAEDGAGVRRPFEALQARDFESEARLLREDALRMFPAGAPSTT